MLACSMQGSGLHDLSAATCTQAPAGATRGATEIAVPAGMVVNLHSLLHVCMLWVELLHKGPHMWRQCSPPSEPIQKEAQTPKSSSLQHA